jgi:hypothetical protein
MTKQEQIEARKIKPIELGDIVMLTYTYVETETEIIGRGKNKREVSKKSGKTIKVKGKVLKINGNLITIANYSGSSIPYKLENIIKSEYISRGEMIVTSDINFFEQTYDDCGVNPFVGKMPDINFYHMEISGLLHRLNINKDGEEEEKETYRGVNLNPYVYNANGEKEYYQRDFVWSLEQKQLLIDSIYNGIEIGKFLFRYNSWERLEEMRIQEGRGYGMDCVDGKQRINAIISFLRNEFPDSHGNYWSDLSLIAQRNFTSYRNLAYGEMNEKTTDKEVIDTFLTLNFTGVPMSKEHIEHVRKIKL